MLANRTRPTSAAGSARASRAGGLNQNDAVVRPGSREVSQPTEMPLAASKSLASSKAVLSRVGTALTATREDGSLLAVAPDNSDAPTAEEIADEEPNSETSPEADPAQEAPAAETPAPEAKEPAETEEDQDLPENPYDLVVQLQREQRFEARAQEKRQQQRKALLDPATAAAAALGNTRHEQLVLDYVESFSRQYRQLYPLRRELLLCPPNEYGVLKFVCTTIQPSQLPFEELYQYDQCAQFVKSYLAYEPLDPPHELPSAIPSPAFTLRSQSGNAFDYAILLTSLLRGVGYDAHVVSGYAVRETTLLDQTHLDGLALGIPPVYRRDTLATLPQIVAAEREGLDWSKVLAGVGLEEGRGAAAPAAEASALKYKVRMGRQLKSTFIQRQEARAAAAATASVATAAAAEPQAEQDAAARDDQDDEDELHGLRVHAWVLIQPGKREIAEPFFIEPTTGKVHAVSDPNYLGVESVFSSSNYWVNMQRCPNGLAGLSLDLGNSMNWEVMFYSQAETENASTAAAHAANEAKNSAAAAAAAAAAELGNTAQGNVASPADATAGTQDDAAGRGNQSATTADPDAEETGSELSLLKLPVSWVAPLSLAPERFRSKCPFGQKYSTYKNARVEEFAPGFRQDGLVTRVTYFADDASGFGGQIREFFAARRDKLVQRIRIPELDEIQELFAPGRPQALKRHTVRGGRTCELLFYSNVRADGLIRRTDSPQKTILEFLDRPDGLAYRSITFADDGSSAVESASHQSGPATTSAAAILKMTEKFVAPSDAAVAAAMIGPTDIAKRTYFLADRRIVVVYQLAADRIFPAWREFRKLPSSETRVAQFMDYVTVFDADQSRPAPLRQQLYAQYLQLQRDEQACNAAYKHFDKELREILLTRQSEEADIALGSSVYDVAPMAVASTLPKGAAAHDAESAAAGNSATAPLGEAGKDSGAQRDATVTVEDAVDSRAAAAAPAAIDYLTPYLMHAQNPNQLSVDEALTAKEQCLAAFKQHLIDRMAIIQQQLTSLTAEYQARQLAYSKNSESMSVEESEEYVQFCSDALFKVHILEKRLAKHKETAPQAYLDMDARLRADARLAVLLRQAQSAAASATPATPAAKK